MTYTLLAQATGTPNNGASNAKDFQPETRNPQTGQINTQPQSTGVQSPLDQNVLNQPNTRISVPSNPADPLPETASVKGGINILLIVVISTVIVIAVEYFFRRRDRNQLVVAGVIPDAAAMTAVPEPPIATAPAEKPQPTPKKKKSKSKSKRKNK